MARRGHGEGSIVKRGDGIYAAALRIGDGKRKWFYGKTRKEVQRKLTEARRIQAEGRLVDAPTQKTGEYLDWWLENCKKATVRPTTYDNYALNISRLKPHIGNIRLDALRYTHIQESYTALHQRGLSQRSVEQAHTVLHTALTDAVKRQLIGHNPMDLVTRPTPPHKEMQYLTPNQIERLFESTADDRLYPLWVFLITTGLRSGEALGLRWQDVDLEAATIAVRQTVHVQKGKGLSFGEPKTPQSRRRVDLSVNAVKALRRQETQQKLERLAAGPAWAENDLVFRTVTGRPIHPSTVNHALHRRLKRAGLPMVRVHDLRHTTATYLLSQGVQPRVIQELLGHATYSQTMNTYAHVIPTLHKDAMRHMDRLFQRQSDAS